MQVKRKRELYVLHGVQLEKHLLKQGKEKLKEYEERDTSNGT